LRWATPCAPHKHHTSDGTMAPPNAPRRPRQRLGILLWAAATLGAVVITAAVLPQLAPKMPLPAPVWLLVLASTVQSGLIVALAVWAGVTLTSEVGLRAPALEAAASGQPIAPALRPQLLPGAGAGVLGGVWLFTSLRTSPTAIATLQGQFTPPLYARMLYGGITEEVLLRWGLMTTFVWLAWRLIQRRRGPVRQGLVWLGIAASAILFGIGHLPVAGFLLGSLTVPLVLFVVGLNATFGILFGWLFWRWGLESAILAHAVTHLVGAVLTALG
jgi:Type II CAAX prenyl endopeptidase Rce1-like